MGWLLVVVGLLLFVAQILLVWRHKQHSVLGELAGKGDPVADRVVMSGEPAWYRYFGLLGLIAIAIGVILLLI